jgi:uncharacterized phage protein (TIGR01671 family)
MREIEFRLWNGESMQQVGAITFFMDGEYNVNDELPVVKGGKNILMQYTGLKDKNGKEVFEDDIVQFKVKDICLPHSMWDEGVRMDDREAKASWETRVSKVVFENGTYKLGGLPDIPRLVGNILPYGNGGYEPGLTNYTDTKDEWQADFKVIYKDFEVIGNVWETPELLKEAK